MMFKKLLMVEGKRRGAGLALIRDAEQQAMTAAQRALAKDGLTEVFALTTWREMFRAWVVYTVDPKLTPLLGSDTKADKSQYLGIQSSEGRGLFSKLVQMIKYSLSYHTPQPLQPSRTGLPSRPLEITTLPDYYSLQQQSLPGQGQSYSNIPSGTMPAYPSSSFSQPSQYLEGLGMKYGDSSVSTGKMPATSRSRYPESSVDHADPSNEYCRQPSQLVLEEYDSGMQSGPMVTDDGVGQGSSAAWAANVQRNWVRVTIERGHKSSFYFTSSKGSKKHTSAGEWEKGEYTGRSVWIYRGRGSNYYTTQRLYIPSSKHYERPRSV